jgi:hypothetical protein
LAELEADARVLLLLTLGTAAVGFVLSVGWIAYFARLGYRTLRLRSYPPPGTVVVFRTRIRSGREAMLAAYASIAFAAVMVLPLVLLSYLTWLLTGAL